MKKHVLIGFVLFLALASCSKTGLESPSSPGVAITFSSFRQQVYTRADISEYNFIKDTKYTLLAVKSAASESAYAWESEMGFNEQPQAGQEGEDNKIVYTPVSTYPDNSSLDFFGLTYSSKETAPTLDDGWGDGVTPTVTLSDASGSLPDLMHCKDAKGKTPSDGVVLLPFEHALAAVNLLIACEDDKSTSTISVKNVKVTEIRLDNVAKSAKMNVASGEWTRIGEKGSRSVFTGEQALQVGSNEQSLAQKYPIGPKDFLVFPNKNGGTVEEAVLTLSLTGIMDNGSLMNGTLSNGVVVTNGACTISVPIYDTSGSSTEEFPLEFKRNHKYTLSILVSHSKVRIVAVNPQVLEWVTVEPGTDHMGTLGQPITFGGIVWMDRNLGATSADCYGDWWHSCGYFYQFGRNIPYIINLDDILDENGKEKTSLKTGEIPDPDNDNEDTNSFKFHINEGAVRNGTFWNDREGIYMIYTYDNHGNKVYDWYGGNDYIYELDENQRTLSGRTYLAVNPGEEGYYGMMVGGTNYTYLAYNPDGTHNEANDNYWMSETNPFAGNPKNQPVPKGWRMPTRADGYKILPEPSQHANDWMKYRASLFQGHISDLDAAIPDASAAERLQPVLGDDNYRYQYIRGRIHIDKSAPVDSDGLTPVGLSVSPNDGPNDAPCIYGIKHQGTSQAYRLMIRRMESNEQRRYFVRISLFPSSPSEVFKTDVDLTGNENSPALAYNGTNVERWNLHEFDWDNPSAFLDFPLQGHLDSYGTFYYGDPFWCQIGLATIFRLPEPCPGGGNWTFYMRNATSGVAVGYGSRRALGDPIRLIRDL